MTAQVWDASSGVPAQQAWPELGLLGSHPGAQVAFAAADRSLLYAEPGDRLEEHLCASRAAPGDRGLGR